MDSTGWINLPHCRLGACGIEVFPLGADPRKLALPDRLEGASATPVWRDQPEITSRMCRLSMTSPLGSSSSGVPAG